MALVPRDLIRQYDDTTGSTYATEYGDWASAAQILTMNPGSVQTYEFPSANLDTAYGSRNAVYSAVDVMAFDRASDTTFISLYGADATLAEIAARNPDGLPPAAAAAVANNHATPASAPAADTTPLSGSVVVSNGANAGTVSTVGELHTALDSGLNVVSPSSAAAAPAGTPSTQGATMTYSVSDLPSRPQDAQYLSETAGVPQDLILAYDAYNKTTFALDYGIDASPEQVLAMNPNGVVSIDPTTGAPVAASIPFVPIAIGAGLLYFLFRGRRKAS